MHPNDRYGRLEEEYVTEPLVNTEIRILIFISPCLTCKVSDFFKDFQIHEMRKLQLTCRNDLWSFPLSCLEFDVLSVIPVQSNSNVNVVFTNFWLVRNDFHHFGPVVPNKMILFRNTLNINNDNKYVLWVFLPAGINPAINEWLFWVGPNVRP